MLEGTGFEQITLQSSQNRLNITLDGQFEPIIWQNSGLENLEKATKITSKITLEGRKMPNSLIFAHS